MCPDKEGWPITDYERRVWELEGRLAAAENRAKPAPKPAHELTPQAIENFLRWMAIKGYVICREDNSGGTFSQAWERVNLADVLPMIDTWLVGYIRVEKALRNG